MEADTRIRAAPSDGMALNTLFGASCPPLLPLRVVSSYVSLSQAAMRPTPTRMALRPRCAPPPVVAPYQRPRRTEEECCVVGGGGIGGGGLGGGGLEAGGRVLGNSIRCQAPSQHFTAGPHLRFTIQMWDCELQTLFGNDSGKFLYFASHFSGNETFRRFFPFYFYHSDKHHVLLFCFTRIFRWRFFLPRVFL